MAKHLKYWERVALEVYIREGLSNNQIAKKLGRDPSTITREINRNKSGPERRHYAADTAKSLMMCRKRISARNAQKPPQVWEYVEEKIKEGWTPELISGRISIDIPELSVSHEAIYQYVYRSVPDITGYLPQRRLVRRPRGPRRSRRSVIPNRLSIEHRSDIANKRQEIGHWESDSLVSSKSKVSLNVLVERKSRLTKLTKIPNLTAAETTSAIVKNLIHLPKQLRRSITYDNGFENTKHQETNRMLRTRSFFCSPYHSWEKGSVENVNMLIRRYIPKKMDIADVCNEDLKYIENRLNNRPKKCLDYQTPLEVFNQYS
jgi:IS30 family transposase